MARLNRAGVKIMEATMKQSMRQTLWGVMLTLPVIFLGSALAQDGEAIYKEICAFCHKTMSNAAYKGRSIGALTESVIKGKGEMKPRAGKPSLKDEEIRAAVTYLLSR
jgi:cytochrome c5